MNAIKNMLQLVVLTGCLIVTPLFLAGCWHHHHDHHRGHAQTMQLEQTGR